MSGDEDRPGFLDREKKSFSELDRARRDRSSSGERRPRSPRDQARASAATKQYVKHIDELFSVGRGGPEGERLARELLEARGTPGLADACRAYRDGVGAPAGAPEISCFLDAGDTELVLAGLEALSAACQAGSLRVTPGLRSQLRMLAQEPDDAVAEAAEELLERI